MEDVIRPQTRTEEIASLYDLRKEVMLMMLDLHKLTLTDRSVIDSHIESFRKTLEVIDQKLSTLKA